MKEQRLVIVSNRLPIVLEKEGDHLKVSQGTGGLITALAPALRNRGGLWIGWSGSSDNHEEVAALIANAQELVGYTCCPLSLSQEDINLYYHGFSNEILWPLFHDLHDFCNFVPAYWYGYQKVNKIFAEKVMQSAQENDFIWAHDYHLMLLGDELRKMGMQSRIAFFLHIPFPPLDIFLKLPWRFQIIQSLLKYDLIGFQTMRDKRNFIHCAKTLFPQLTWKMKGQLHVCKTEQQEVSVGAFPISIDYEDFVKYANSEEVKQRAWHIHEMLPNRTLILSIDRLDYTKGIPYRLEAIRCLLKRHPEIHTKVTFIQLIVPSRTDIPRYFTLREEINRLVSEINSEFSQNGWVPIHYFFRSIPRSELVAYYRTCEVALVTSLKDGMNLVSKEFIACDIDHNGVLILSEFAGAAAQLHDEALLVNPYDIEGLAETMHRAISMPAEERKSRMLEMQRNVKRYNIFWWVESFLNAAVHKELKDFPIIQEYIPKPGEQNHI